MTEAQLEQDALGWLTELGYTHRYGPDIAHDGAEPQRAHTARCYCRFACVRPSNG